MEALRDTFFNTELDAIGIRYAGSIQEAAKTNEAAITRATANAQSAQFKTAAYRTVLQSGEKTAKVAMGMP